MALITGYFSLIGAEQAVRWARLAWTRWTATLGFGVLLLIALTRPLGPYATGSGAPSHRAGA